jgi:hypothetical protein
MDCRLCRQVNEGRSENRYNLMVAMQGLPAVLREMSTQLGQTTLMPPTGEFRFHPLPDYIKGYFRADHPTAEAEYIGIVVLAAHPRGVGLVAERSPNVPVPVGGHGHADPCPADQYATFAFAVQDMIAHFLRKIGIVNGFPGMTARI